MRKTMCLAMFAVLLPIAGSAWMNGRTLRNPSGSGGAVRQYPACIALFLHPSAKSACVVGAEAEFYRKPFETAGVKVLDEKSGASPTDDIVSILPKGVSAFDIEKLRAIPGVKRISELMPLQLDLYPEEPMEVPGAGCPAARPSRNALFLAAEWLPQFKFIEGTREEATNAIFRTDACVITETMSRARKLHKGDKFCVAMGGRKPKTPVELPIVGVVDLDWNMETSCGLVRGHNRAPVMTDGPVFVSFDTLESLDSRPATMVKMTHLWVEYEPEFLKEKGVFAAGREVERAIAHALGLNPGDPDTPSKVRLHARDELAHRADIVLVATQPDWLMGTDFPTGDDWQRLADMRAPGGLVALHVDVDPQRFSLGRLKRILSEFRTAFGPYFLWCIGANDYVVTSASELAADKLYDLFADEKVSEAFAAMGIYTPSDVFACYMGRDVEIEPVLQKVAASDRTTVTWQESRKSLDSLSAKDAPCVRPGLLTPYYIPPMPWFTKGDAEPAGFAGTTNAIKGVQVARREFLAGFDDIGEGVSTNAIERWAVAAKVSPRDPVLRGLVDVVDLKGRQLLGVGNVNGALGCYEKLLLIRPNDAAIVHNYGVCLKKGGQMEMAAQVFARAVELDPATDEHRVEMVECCAASGHEDVAVQVLDVLMKRHPDDPALKLRAAKLMSIRNGKARNTDRAVRLAEEAVAQTGWKDRAYVLGLADVYIECGRVKDGVMLKRKMKTMKFDR